MADSRRFLNGDSNFIIGEYCDLDERYDRFFDGNHNHSFIFYIAQFYTIGIQSPNRNWL